MKHQNKIGIRTKITLAPALLIVLLLMLSAYAVFILNSNTRHMAEQRHLNAKADQANALVTGILSMQSNLYRLVSIASMEEGSDKVTTMARTVQAQIEALGPKAAQLSELAQDAGLSAAEAQDGTATLQRFMKSARTVTEMADTDVGTALTMMAPVDRNFEKLAIILKSMQTAINRISEDGAAIAYHESTWAQRTFLMASVSAGLIAALLTWRLSNRIANPIRALTKTMIRLEHRDYDAEIRGQDLHDEIGDMARAVQDFKHALIAADTAAAQQEAEKRAQMERADRIATLSREFEDVARTALGEVASASQQMQSTSQNMTDIASQTQDQARTVGDAAIQTSRNVQNVASAAEQLAASINAISTQVQQASNVARDAVDEATRVDQIVGGLDQSITKIGEVVKLISDIASQTNLLALNATIEAARAGEAGKGFAVVAGEVKNLANQTAKATTEITAQIQEIQVASRSAVSALSGITNTIDGISGISANIATAITEQEAATRDISQSVQQAANGTDLVTRNIEGVTQASEQTGAAARQVLGAADALASQAGNLNQRVGSFLIAVRNA